MADSGSEASEAENALRALDRMSDGVFALDADWRFTYVNEAALPVLSRAAGEELTTETLVGREFWETFPEVVGTVFERKYREAMKTGEPLTVEEYYEPLDAWFEVRISPSDSGITVLFRSLTSDRDRQDLIREREAVLGDIYEAISDQNRPFEDRVRDLLAIGQRVLGTKYGTLSRVTDDNYEFQFVVSPDDGITAGDVVDLESTNCERTVALERTLVLSDVAKQAPEMTDRAGYTEWGITCYLGTPVFVNDVVYGTFCFYDTEPRDEPFSDWEVTLVDLMGKWVGYALERDLAEDRLRKQNERLERFASLVSHDLRNPLSVASGRLELARETGDLEHLDAVERAHERIDTLITDILTMARVGGVVEDVAMVDLVDVAERAWGGVSESSATLSLPDELFVSADESRLQQLLENLFRNSVEHGGSGVTVEVGELVDGFYVQDDGPGIPEEDRDSVFEFGETSSETGTGFGLAIVREITNAHEWDIHLTESPEGGARFEITGVTKPVP